MFNIKKETPKALLLEEEGKTFWIQKRWMQDNGTLTPAGEKARAEAQTPREQKAEKNTMIGIMGKIERETERAILFDAFVENAAQCFGVKIWFPKSQIKICEGSIEVPAWLHSAKEAEHLKAKGAWFRLADMEA